MTSRIPTHTMKLDLKLQYRNLNVYVGYAKAMYKA